MEISDIPAFSSVYPGESVRSWLDATRILIGLSEAEWWAWCLCDSVEPERPLHKRAWTDLPSGLGHALDIPVDFRVAPGWRDICCPLCVTEARSGTTRHPVLAAWLDVRTICCAEHGFLLCHRAVSRRVDVSEEPELSRWNGWLQEWRSDEKLDLLDRRLRRDLALAAARNWAHYPGPIASVSYSWTLAEKGWVGTGRGHLYPPGRPSRVGMLAPIDRLSALYAAWRAWLALRMGEEVATPDWPIEAWIWLEKRWRLRGYGTFSDKITGVAAALSRKHLEVRSAPSPRLD